MLYMLKWKKTLDIKNTDTIGVNFLRNNLTLFL